MTESCELRCQRAALLFPFGREAGDTMRIFKARNSKAIQTQSWKRVTL